MYYPNLARLLFMAFVEEFSTFMDRSIVKNCVVGGVCCVGELLPPKQTQWTGFQFSAIVWNDLPVLYIYDRAEHSIICLFR